MVDQDDREDLMAALRDAAARHDPVPDRVVQAARAALTWRTVDAELAELVDDSALTAGGVRSASGGRLLTFDAPACGLVVEVTSTGDRRRLVGELTTPGRAHVAVTPARGPEHHEHTEDAVGTTTDERGRFVLDDVPPGVVRLVVARSEASPAQVVTSWVSL
jgi:hypothetical protein